MILLYMGITARKPSLGYVTSLGSNPAQKNEILHIASAATIFCFFNDQISDLIILVAPLLYTLLSRRPILLFGPQHQKTRLQSFRQSEIQTSLLSYRDNLEN